MDLKLAKVDNISGLLTYNKVDDNKLLGHESFLRKYELGINDLGLFISNSVNDNEFFGTFLTNKILPNGSHVKLSI